MIEPLRTWVLLQQLRSHVYASSQKLKILQDSLFREALLHAYQHVPFYRRYWNEAGFDAQGVRGTQDLDRVPIMTNPMARTAAEHGELLAQNLDATSRTFLYTTGSSGSPMCIARGRREERLWRAQGLRIWMEHGFHWRHKKAQFNQQAGTRHFLQRLGISRTQWIDPIVPFKDLRDRFLEAKADWIIATPTVLRGLATAVADAGGDFPPLRGIYCQGELLDTQTRDLGRRVFGIMPVDVYTLTELGYVAWQCERHERLHVNADTHLVEVLRNGVAVSPGVLGRVVVTDLCNRAMPFLRYETGDLAISGKDNCACGRRFPCLMSMEGRQRDAVQLTDGRIITGRCLIDHLAQMLPLEGYRLHQDTTTRFRLELFTSSGEEGDTRTHEPACLDNKEVLETHLRALLGNVEIVIQTGRTPPEKGEKTYPVVINFPARIA